MVTQVGVVKGFLMDEAQERHWKQFGRYLMRLIDNVGMSVTEFADASGITLTQASRLVNGQSGTRRTTLPRFVAALRLTTSEQRELYRMAGFTLPAELDLYGNREKPEEDEWAPDDGPTEVYYRGLPPEMQDAFREMIKAAYLANEKAKTTHGKKAE